MGGSCVNRVCQECASLPLIKEKSWTKHCIDHHNGRKDVEYTKCQDLKQSAPS